MSRMAQDLRCWCSWLAIGGVLITSLQEGVFAQITPDNTLPNNSSVIRDGNTFTITGGTQAGSNLFHSFSEFSVPTGGTASFNNAVDIQNIISRVTGRSASNIDGLIRSLGTANLFLINPNGIIFGQNAQLNIGGSFVGSTASSLNFADGNQFSATAPQTATLLTISIPIGLQYGGNVGGIQNQSRATSSSNELVGLQVQPGRTLALVGGNVSLDGGSLNAQGGRVEIAGLAGSGVVGLFVDGNGLRLNFPDTVARANVYLDNRAEVNVRASGGSSIAINAQNLNLAQGSKLKAGIAPGLGAGNTRAGDIEINSTGNVSFDGEGSGAYNQVESNAIGNAGNINVTAVSLSVTKGGELNTSTEGQGNAGNVNVNASNTVFFVAEGPNNISSRVYSRVEKTGVGQGGDIYIKTGSLLVSDGAFLSASTLGIGDAGDVTIDAGDIVSFVGAGPLSNNFWPSGAYTQVYKDAKGQGGNINITTGSLLVTNGARLITSTRGQGNAGNVNINARYKVSFIGESPNNSSSGAFTRVEKTGVGQGGDIYIKTGSLLVSDGAFLGANTNGRGNAGNVTIHGRDIVSFIGSGPPADDFFPSVAQTQVNPGARGQGGDIIISTGSLKIAGGAFLSARSLGIGDAGNVIIKARDRVSFDGVGRNRRYYPYLGSGAYTQVDKTGVGQAGDIDISTGSLEVTGGAYLSAGTLGIGDAGDVSIHARDQVSFDGVGTNGLSSGAYGQARFFDTQGQGGSINITAGSLFVTNGAVLSSSTYSQKNAGNVNINVSGLVSFNGVGTNGVHSGAHSQVENGAGGHGGSVNITTGSLFLTNGALVSARTFGKGNAGNVNIRANTFEANNGAQVTTTTSDEAYAGSIIFKVKDSIILSGSQTGLFASTDPGSTGNGGSIIIDPRIITIRDGASIAVGSEGEGTGGDIQLTAGRLTLDRGTISATTRSNTGGNINLNLQELLLLRHRSQISTTAGLQQFGGNGGNITINTPNGFIVTAPTENNDITANAYTGQGGNIQINAFGIYGTQFRAEENPLTSDITASSDLGINGTVELNTPDIDPNSGLIELPAVPVDTEVAQGCYSPSYAQSKFFITGRGGLPTNPKDILTPDAAQIDWVAVNPSNNNLYLAPVSIKPTTSTPQSIVEATGATLNAKGQIVLSANSSNATPHTSRQSQIGCHGN